MNTRSPYGPMVQQQQMGGVQARPMQYQRPAPQEAERKKDGGGMGAMGGAASGAMGSMMSDERSKKEIAQLESANEALTKALSSKAEYPTTQAPKSDSWGGGELDEAQIRTSRGNMPGADYPSMPSNTRVPVPSAERVAAQNVAMQQTAPMGQPAQPVQGGGTGFGFRPGMPNMSDLDEAYARMGQGG